MRKRLRVMGDKGGWKWLYEQSVWGERERGRDGDMIGQWGLEEVRVGLTCIRIRQRCEGSLGPTAAVAQGASHFSLQDVCVCTFCLTDKIQSPVLSLYIGSIQVRRIQLLCTCKYLLTFLKDMTGYFLFLFLWTNLMDRPTVNSVYWQILPG